MFGFIQKQCSKNFAQLNLRILKLFTREVCIYLKSRLIFKRFYCVCMLINKHFINKGAYNSESKRCKNPKPSEYSFYVRTKISLDFHICISVPLKTKRAFKVRPSPSKQNSFICFNGSLLKMMKNAFYFTLKALFILKILNFLS